MKYGRVAGNRHINAAIYECFEQMTERDAQSFVRKFERMASDEQLQMHTFRELLLGGFLGSQGFQIRSELPIDGKTPDWAILDGQLRPIAIVELVNFHNELRVERDMAQAKEERRIWSGWMPDNTRRICTRLADKAAAYRSLAEGNNIPYVIALFGEFNAAVEEDELLPCLHHEEFGIFEHSRHISGVLFFDEHAGHYNFKYHTNALAERSFSLASGWFPRMTA